MLSQTLAALEAFDNQHDFERLAADVLNAWGCADVVLQAPRGGPDGGRDVVFSCGSGRQGLAWVTLRKDIAKKFHEDASKRRAGEYSKYYLFCTAHLTSGQKDAFSQYCRAMLGADFTPQDCEALRSILDTRFSNLREQYLGQNESKADRRPVKIVRAFPASIVFNEAENLPQMFFDMDSDIGQRLTSKSSVARPYQNVDGKAMLMVEVPVTDDQKFLHGADALQCKILADICSAQRGGWKHQLSANKGVVPAKTTTPNTPDPIDRLPGTAILDALAANRFAQNSMFRLQFEYSEIPFPGGTSIRLDARPSQPGAGPEQRRVLVDVPGKTTLVVSVEPLVALGAGALPQGASVPGGAQNHCRTFTYSVRVDAEIMRAGNHDDVIQDYKAWIERLANEFQSHNTD